MSHLRKRRRRDVPFPGIRKIHPFEKSSPCGDDDNVVFVDDVVFVDNVVFDDYVGCNCDDVVVFVDNVVFDDHVGCNCDDVNVVFADLIDNGWQ